MYKAEVAPNCRECGEPAKNRGLCIKHYFKAYRSGSMSIHRPTRLQVKLAKILKNVSERCSDPRVNSFEYYGGKGIKNQLTLADLEALWNRDQAWKMRKPSIDRINVALGYSVDNCRFIEWGDNSRRGKLGPTCRHCAFQLPVTAKRRICTWCLARRRRFKPNPPEGDTVSPT